MYLESIDSPADVRSLPETALPALCEEIRSAVLVSSAAVGGHVGSNLGIVELSVALHRVFASPRDKLVFDVSHQTYPHKMLTGRAQAFLDPAHYDDVSGFSSPGESEHDLFAMGHTSTSVSLACGLAKARDLAGEAYDVVAVIGDGSLSGGLAFEGLDNAAELEGGLIIVVNDNEWSIAPDAGGLYAGLARLRQTRGQAPDNLFRALGLEYRYLEEGNDVLACVRALDELRGHDRPVVLHVHTRKGAGYAPALADEEGWHHVGPFDLATGERRVRPAGNSPRDLGFGDVTGESYAELTGERLLDRMAEDRTLVAISAATPYMMGFTPERRARAGRQFVDVGIAEEHAVSFATGLAKAGATPVFGVYATFLQRAYDQLWHDLCLNGQPAVILVFGASAFGTADATHLGFFDVPLLDAMPGLPYLAPTCREEYLAMLDWALAWREGPVAIRVPGAGVVSRPGVLLPADGFGRADLELVRQGSRVALVALGDTLPLGAAAARLLEAADVRPTLVNPRRATCADDDALRGLARGHEVVLTLEDGVLAGGFGEHVARVLGAESVRVGCHGLPLGFPDRYDVCELLGSARLTPEAIAEDALGLLRRGKR